MHFRTSGQLEKARSGARGTLSKVAVTLTRLSLAQVNNFLMGEKRIRRERRGIGRVKIRLDGCVAHGLSEADAGVDDERLSPSPSLLLSTSCTKLTVIGKGRLMLH